MNNGVKTENPPALKLPSVVDIAAVSSLEHAFTNLLAASTTKITLDTASVERIATPGIQLFLSLIKSATASKKQVLIANPSSSVAAAINDLGLTQYFQPHLKDV